MNILGFEIKRERERLHNLLITRLLSAPSDTALIFIPHLLLQCLVSLPMCLLLWCLVLLWAMTYSA